MKIIIQEYEEDPSLDDDQSFLLRSSELTIVDNNHKDARRRLMIKEMKQQHTSSGTSSSFKSSNPLTNLWQSLSKVFVRLFLPIGYPHSVDSTYITYQIFDGIQGLSSYWRGVASTKAVLEATGVGNSEASALSAALNWALRDGTGMIGGLVFSYLCSDKFDIYVKEFRLFADIINDVALTLDMIAPYFDSTQTLYILSASTLCKTMCGMSAGATKGRITQHFARNSGNMADLTAKESTQETLVSLLGMIGGIYVAKLLEHSTMAFTWIIFGLLTYVHVWANYKGVLQLKLATLNPERTRIVFGDLVKTVADSSSTDTKKEDYNAIEQALQNLPTPDQVHESLWMSTCHMAFPTIRVASSTTLFDNDPTKLEFLQEFQNKKYVIGCCSHRHRVYVWLRVGASYNDELQAYLHALVLQELLDTTKTIDAQMIKGTLKDMHKLFNATKAQEGDDNGILIQTLEEKGWDILQNRLYLGFSQTRIQWTIVVNKNE